MFLWWSGSWVQSVIGETDSVVLTEEEYASDGLNSAVMAFLLAVANGFEVSVNDVVLSSLIFPSQRRCSSQNPSQTPVPECLV